MTRRRLGPPSPRCDPTAVVPTATLRRVDDVTPGDDDAELEALEADLATRDHSSHWVLQGVALTLNIA